MTACAEKHVVEALAIHERVNQSKKVDVVASALEYLCELDRCPGPNCNVPFEHTGIHMCIYGKCTLSHSMQVDVRPCIASVAKSIGVFGAEASSSLMAQSTRMMAGQRTTTFLIARKLRMTRRKY
jgi:hypothetical protein